MNDSFNSTLNVTEFVHYLNSSCGRCSFEHDDATWILTSAFIIFTMQSGFGLLECGSVTTKNEVSIMVKNAIDVVFGGLSYLAFGYAFSFGNESESNPFSGVGNFFVSSTGEDIGKVESRFFFQASFATTATTIVSGAMAERTRLEAYIVFSFFNTFIFCFPAHWTWAETGWLKTLGVIDFAGAGPVHVCGGITGLVATLLLKPRHGRFSARVEGAQFASARDRLPMGSPTNALLGMFMLWWGWLGFNCGSTYGISGSKWKLSARAAVATITSSISGGTVGLLISYVTKRKKFDVQYLLYGVISSLVSITSFCALAHPWEAFVTGFIGACLCIASEKLLEYYHVDDPVGCVGIHAVAGAWGLLAAGLFHRDDALYLEMTGQLTPHPGLFHNGGFYLLGVQCLAVLSSAAWSVALSFIFLKFTEYTIGLRMPLDQELLGCDIVDHSVGTVMYDKIKGCVVRNPYGPDVDEMVDILHRHHSVRETMPVNIMSYVPPSTWRLFSDSSCCRALCVRLGLRAGRRGEEENPTTIDIRATEEQTNYNTELNAAMSQQQQNNNAATSMQQCDCDEIRKHLVEAQNAAQRNNNNRLKEENGHLHFSPQLLNRLTYLASSCTSRMHMQAETECQCACCCNHRASIMPLCPETTLPVSHPTCRSRTSMDHAQQDPHVEEEDMVTHL